MRLNPFNLRRPDVIVEEKAFTDSLQSGQEFTISLAADPGRGAQTRRDELAMKLAAEYVPVSAEEEAASRKAGLTPREVKPIRTKGCLDTIVTLSLCEQIACLMEMQETWALNRDLTNDQQPFTFEEWALIAERMPNAFKSVVSFAGELLLRAEGASRTGEGQKGNMARPSDSPSTETADTIPN